MTDNILENRFTSTRIIDGKPRKVIIDYIGKVINRNPTKEELLCLEKEKSTGRKKRYTKKQIIKSMIQFYEENRRVPIKIDFDNDPRYPCSKTVRVYFGNWDSAIIESGLLDKRKRRGGKLYTDEELLGYMKQFNEENGRPPLERDFSNNSRYPHFDTFMGRFGSWENAKKLVGLDIDTMVKKGYLDSNLHKERLFEIFVLEHLGVEDVIDLSGENRSSFVDGICPKGRIYDAKSSGLNGLYWHYFLDKLGVHFYYLGAFNKDYSELQHVWRIPGDFSIKRHINIGIYSSCIYNIENMEKYEITPEFIEIFDNWSDNVQKNK